MLGYLLYIYFLIYTALNFIFALRLYFIKDPLKYSYEWKVSILVAARNEENNILQCLKSLSELNYPIDKLQILIGDDASEDETANIIKSFIKDKPHFQYHFIDHNLPNLRGKQNVLAQLAHHTTGDIFVITDADITHNKDWLAVITAPFDDQRIGVVSGVTVVNPINLWSGFQTLDWLIGMITIKVLDSFGLPVTSVGNNMAVSRKAYVSVGGYESLPFSITEDYLLFQAILNRGFLHQWIFNDKILNRSAHISDLKTLFHQRKRWLHGGVAGPWYALALFGFYSIAYHLLILSYFFSKEIEVTLYCLLLKVIADLIILSSGFVVLKKSSWVKYFPMFIFYNAFNILFINLYAVLPVSIRWKNRIYKD